MLNSHRCWWNLWTLVPCSRQVYFGASSFCFGAAFILCTIPPPPPRTPNRPCSHTHCQVLGGSVILGKVYCGVAYGKVCCGASSYGRVYLGAALHNEVVLFLRVLVRVSSVAVSLGWSVILCSPSLLIAGEC